MSKLEKILATCLLVALCGFWVMMGPAGMNARPTQAMPPVVILPEEPEAKPGREPEVAAKPEPTRPVERADDEDTYRIALPDPEVEAAQAAARVRPSRLDDNGVPLWKSRNGRAFAPENSTDYRRTLSEEERMRLPPLN